MNEENKGKNERGTLSAPCAGSIEFKIERVNLIRMRRGAAAVEIAIFEGGERIGQLWMLKKDVVKNIRQWGTCDAFQTALEIYRTGRDVRESNTPTRENGE